MEWRAFVLKAKTKPGILFTDNGDLFTIRLARSESGFRNPGNFALKYSSGNPEYRFGLESGLQYLESGIHGMESKIQDYLGFHGAKVSRVSGFP